MLRSLSTVAAALLLVACGSDSPGNPMETTFARTAASVSGAYALTEVNSDPLPYTNPEHDIVIESGSLSLTPEGTFSYSVTRSGTENGKPFRVTVEWEGTYQIKGAEVHLIHAETGWRQVASIKDRGIIIPSDPYWYLFAKP